jgi:hypothetical protein
LVGFGSNSPRPKGHPSLNLRQLLCALRSPARRAQDPMLRLQSKFTPNPSFDFRLALFSEEPFIRHAHSGWCPVLAARGVWVVLHTFASFGVPHHPPLTLTPLGLATQDFRLAPGTLLSPAECKLRGIGEGNFLPHMSLRSVRNYKDMRGSHAVLIFDYSKGQ